MRGREMGADELSTGMNVVIENCRSIDCASISIDPGKLNVKFAPNGTGKSSIAKALVAAAGGFDESNLVPFKWLQGGCSEEQLLLFDGCNYRPLLFSNPLFRGLFHF